MNGLLKILVMYLLVIDQCIDLIFSPEEALKILTLFLYGEIYRLEKTENIDFIKVDKEIVDDLR